MFGEVVRPTWFESSTLRQLGKEEFGSPGIINKPSVQTVVKIAKALGVPMEDLVK